MLKCNMKRLISYVMISALLVLCACESAIEEPIGGEDDSLLVYLNVSVMLSDISNTLTKAAEDITAVSDNEKMHTLRIVIVRPNWTVEANRLINLEDVVLRHDVAEPFRVVGNEQKWIYLFVNENTQAMDKESSVTRKLVDFNLNNIVVGGLFPINDIEALKIRLEDDTEQIMGPLPMSERHQYTVTSEEEQTCPPLFVTRAAVKFTIRITNNSDKPVSFDRFTISRMAREEWYMPRAKYGNPNEGQREIIGYEVPAGVGYYIYGNKTSVPTPTMTVEAGGEKVMEPIYLLEGKYTDEKDSRNYSMDIWVNGIKKTHYFPMLPTLPRNTHVLVNIICGMYSEVTCYVDIIPYTEVILDPEFGLKTTN